MPGRPKAWMPRERWDALVRGEDCPLCGDCESAEAVALNRFGYFVADLQLSRLRLRESQFSPGYCQLICAKHVREPYDLSKEELALYIGDMMHVARALELVFEPDKMNFMVLGNAIPHVHSHIVPRYYGDGAPGRPIGGGDPVVTLEPKEYEERVRLIREALGKV